MKRSVAALSLAGVVGLGFAAPAQAQLWYNGNPNLNNGLSSVQNAGFTDTRAFDNFLVPAGPGWFITSLFGHYLSDMAPATAYWEIRSGITLGDGGTLLHFGTNAITWSPSGFDAFGFMGYLATVSGFGPFALDPGLYWLTISVVGDGSGAAFVQATDGAGGINALIDGETFFHSPEIPANFVSDWIPDVDFAYGVDGRLNETVIPEPSAVLLLGTGLGLVSLIARKRRRGGS